MKLGISVTISPLTELNNLLAPYVAAMPAAPAKVIHPTGVLMAPMAKPI